MSLERGRAETVRTKMATEAGGADPQSQSEASVSSAAAPDPVAMHHRWSTYVAMACFGLASWIMTNASYIELGAFLREAPEKYSISAYTIFALQSANVYPFLYMLLNARQQRVSQSSVIWFLLVLGFVVALLMSALWDKTSVVFGARHSVAMLVLTHLGGLVSATSSVVFYPYVATFPTLYTVALSTGEGLSGSLAGLLGIVQAPYDPSSMRFSVEVFYFICALLMLLSLAGFSFLQFHPWAKLAQAQDHARQLKERQEHAPLVQNGVVLGEHPSTRVRFAQVWQFLACQVTLAAFSFGVIPSIMPYVYKKFAPVDDAEDATSRYQTIASIAALILDPVARAVSSQLRFYHVRGLTVFLVFIASMLLGFSLTTEPFLSRSSSSSYLLPLIAHVFYLVLYAYTQTMIYLTLKNTSSAYDDSCQQQVYQWSGFGTQLGAFAGTAVIFPLVFFHESIFVQ